MDDPKVVRIFIANSADDRGKNKRVVREIEHVGAGEGRPVMYTEQESGFVFLLKIFPFKRMRATLSSDEPNEKLRVRRGRLAIMHAEYKHDHVPRFFKSRVWDAFLPIQGEKNTLE